MSTDTAQPSLGDSPIPFASTISADERAANVEWVAAKQANSTTAIYGISGSGKSSLADTAVEYAWETFKKITLGYVNDLGGFGNNRIALIRAGILRVWDPRNHVNAFETMELMSLGAFPEKLIDPETGYAAPDVKLILPRRFVYTLICPQGHVVTRADEEVTFRAQTIACPECGVMTNYANALRVQKTLVRHKMFRDVGLRIYDGFTALNDWGMHEIQRQDAAGTLPTSSRGGSALSGADAIRSGKFSFTTGSQPQYGFMQNRTLAWLSNIKTIPDQVVPAIATFLVDAAEDEKTGSQFYGMKIAGSARTGAAASWVGNLLHATKEPYSETDPRLVHRLWMTNHIDPRDPRKMPYLAKHRGTPLGIDYLEDAPGEKPWSGCSLKVFFQKLDAQLKELEAQKRAAYPDAPGMWTGEAADGDVDEVLSEVVPAAAGAGVAVTATPTVTGSNPLRVRRPGVARVANAPAAAAIVPAVITPAPSAGVTSTPATPAHVGAVAPATAVPSAPEAASPAVVVPSVAAPSSPAPTPAAVAPAPPAQPTSPPSGAATGARPIRRIRPPVG